MYDLNQEHVDVGKKMQMYYFVLALYALWSALNMEADEIYRLWHSRCTCF